MNAVDRDDSDSTSQICRNEADCQSSHGVGAKFLLTVVVYRIISLTVMDSSRNLAQPRWSRIATKPCDLVGQSLMISSTWFKRGESQVWHNGFSQQTPHVCHRGILVSSLPPRESAARRRTDCSAAARAQVLPADPHGSHPARHRDRERRPAREAGGGLDPRATRERLSRPLLRAPERRVSPLDRVSGRCSWRRASGT